MPSSIRRVTTRRTPARAAGHLQVVVEVAPRRAFASAVEWPGWCRSGRTPEAALEALAAYAPRYSVAAKAAGLRLPSGTADTLDVIERLPGSATTEFGAPGVVAEDDFRACTAREAARLAALVQACWHVLDDVAATAPPELRKGPRGGGRDRDAIVGHVIRAESSYARKLGVRMRESEAEDPVAVARMRSEIVAALEATRSVAPASDKSWPPRYMARRIAWHALDHAWEIEDRS
jgi:hypothetical protein